MRAGVSLRTVTSADRDHLFRVYASTRADELALVPWGAEQKLAFLQQQFDARETDYTRRYAEGEHSVVERDGVPVGYLWIHRAADEVRVIDVALLPEHRNSGIGTSLMQPLIDEARSRRVPLRLYVLAESDARRLYERLGFAAVGEASVYQSMELLP